MSNLDEENGMREERARGFASLLRGKRMRFLAPHFKSFSSLKNPALILLSQYIVVIVRYDARR